jgi:hypothetical protein
MSATDAPPSIDGAPAAGRMPLAALQAHVQSWLLAGGDVPTALRDAVHAPADTRWRIYGDAYRIRLVAGLKEAFPAFVRRVGDDVASALLVDFVRATPSAHRSLRDYGGAFPALLARDAADAPGSELHLVAELAEFEWALAASYDAPEARALTHEDLAVVAPEQWGDLTFAVAPHVRRLRLRTNAPEAWRAAMREEGSEPPAARLEAAPVDWLTWRHELDALFRWMEPAEAAAFDACASGVSFAELCERLADDRDRDAGSPRSDEAGPDGELEHADDAPLRAATWLHAWIADGLLVARSGA